MDRYLLLEVNLISNINQDLCSKMVDILSINFVRTYGFLSLENQLDSYCISNQANLGCHSNFNANLMQKKYKFRFVPQPRKL